MIKTTSAPTTAIIHGFVLDFLFGTPVDVGFAAIGISTASCSLLNVVLSLYRLQPHSGQKRAPSAISVPQLLHLIVFIFFAGCDASFSKKLLR